MQDIGEDSGSVVEIGFSDLGPAPQKYFSKRKSLNAAWQILQDPTMIVLLGIGGSMVLYNRQWCSLVTICYPA